MNSSAIGHVDISIIDSGGYIVGIDELLIQLGFAGMQDDQVVLLDKRFMYLLIVETR